MNIVSRFLLAVAATASLALPTFAGEYPWAKDMDSAFSELKTNGKKLLMIDFYTDWCNWCKRMDKDTYSNAKVQALGAQMINLKVNAEKEGADLAQQYKVSGFPTILFISSNGDIAGRIVGYLAPNQFERTVKVIIDVDKRFESIKKVYSDNPKEGKPAAQYAHALAIRGQGEKAIEALSYAESANFKGQEMVQAYLAVGDYWQVEVEEMVNAIECFNKAAAIATKDVDKGYAYISIAYCELSRGDLKAAKEAARKVVALKEPDAHDKELAQEILKMEASPK